MNQQLPGTPASATTVIAVQEQAAASAVQAARVLLRCALASGGRPLVQQVEAGVRTGGVPMLRVGLLSGGAELTLTVGDIEVLSISGELPDDVASQ